MTRTLVAVDMDRTMIYSPAAAALGSSEGDGPVDVVHVEKYEGRDASAMTARAGVLWCELARRADLVPVTTRTMTQFRRVQWPGGAVRHAITTNGARLLIDGIEDHDWTTQVHSLLSAGCAPIEEVRAHLAGAGPWLLRLRDAEDTFCYAVIDRAALPEEDLLALRAWAGERNWVVSVQGRKLYCVPAPLTKSAAIGELAERLGSTMTLAAGDSVLDAEMLAWADRAIRPAHGELADAGWITPGLCITRSAGVRAGEEILDWALHQLA